MKTNIDLYKNVGQIKCTDHASLNNSVAVDKHILQ